MLLDLAPCGTIVRKNTASSLPGSDVSSHRFRIRSYQVHTDSLDTKIMTTSNGPLEDARVARQKESNRATTTRSSILI